jgi:hypothetical protein
MTDAGSCGSTMRHDHDGLPIVSTRILIDTTTDPISHFATRFAATWPNIDTGRPLIQTWAKALANFSVCQTLPITSIGFTQSFIVSDRHAR